MRIEGKPGNFEQRKTVHCPLSYLNYILQMNVFLSLNPLFLKLAQSCSAMPRVVRSLSTSEEGNCREIVSFPHPPSLPASLLITSQKSFVRSRGAKRTNHGISRRKHLSFLGQQCKFLQGAFPPLLFNLDSELIFVTNITNYIRGEKSVR